MASRDLMVDVSISTRRVEAVTWLIENVCRRVVKVWPRAGFALAHLAVWWACRSVRVGKAA